MPSSCIRVMPRRSLAALTPTATKVRAGRAWLMSQGEAGAAQGGGVGGEAEVDLVGAGLDDRAEVGAGEGEGAAVEVEAEGQGRAGVEQDAGEGAEREGRARDAGDRVADEGEETGGADAGAGVGDAGGDCDAAGRERLDGRVGQGEVGVAEAVAEGELRGVRQVEVLAGVLVARRLGAAAGAGGIGDRDLAGVARPGDGEAGGRGCPRRSAGAATAVPAPVPGNQQARVAAACSKTSGIARGRPEKSSTTVGVPVARTAAASSAWRPGRSMRARLAASPLIQAASPRQRRTVSAWRGGGDGLGDAVGGVGLDRDALDVGDGGVGQGGAQAFEHADRLVGAAGAGPGAEHLGRGVGERADQREAAGGRGERQGAVVGQEDDRAAGGQAGAARRRSRRRGVGVGFGAGAAAVGVVEEAEAVLEGEDAGDGGVDGLDARRGRGRGPAAGRSGRRATSCRCRRRR